MEFKNEYGVMKMKRIPLTGKYRLIQRLNLGAEMSVKDTFGIFIKAIEIGKDYVELVDFQVGDKKVSSYKEIENYDELESVLKEMTRYFMSIIQEVQEGLVDEDEKK